MRTRRSPDPRNHPHAPASCPGYQSPRYPRSLPPRRHPPPPPRCAQLVQGVRRSAPESAAPRSTRPLAPAPARPRASGTGAAPTQENWGAGGAVPWRRCRHHCLGCRPCKSSALLHARDALQAGGLRMRTRRSPDPRNHPHDPASCPGYQSPRFPQRRHCCYCRHHHPVRLPHCSLHQDQGLVCLVPPAQCSPPGPLHRPRPRAPCCSPTRGRACWTPVRSFRAR